MQVNPRSRKYISSQDTLFMELKFLDNLMAAFLSTSPIASR